MTTTAQRPMTEDELLTGITEALTLSGWWWFHIRRSDAALVQGMQGWPDVFAVHPTRKRALAWELKADRGVVTHDQAAWLASLRAFARETVYIGGYSHPSLDVRLVYPRDYDRALSYVFHGWWPDETTDHRTP